MKDKICLNIVRSKSWLNIIHNGEIIGKIEVSEGNRGSHCNLALYGDKSVTRFKLERVSLDDESRFNKEEYNK